MPGEPLVDAGLFTGRSGELALGLQFVLQVAAGKPRHLLITGPRGIGKSTLALAVIGMARAERQYLDLLPNTGDISFRGLLVAPHVAQQGEGPEDLASSWVQRLRRDTTSSLGLTIDEAEISVAIARFRVRRNTRIQETAAELVSTLRPITREVAHFADGILLYADELDEIADDTKVASFYKVFSEQLAQERLANVGLMVVGQDSLADQLIAGHASTVRLFQRIILRPLADDEVRDLVDTGLLGTGTTIEAAAMDALVAGASGYPSRAQLIAHEAFALAGQDSAGTTNYVIGVATVANALQALYGRGELAAVSQDS